MTKNTYRSNTFKNTRKKEGRDLGSKRSIGFFRDKRFQLSIGFFLIVVAVFLITSFISYIFTGKADQSVVNAIEEVNFYCKTNY